MVGEPVRSSAGTSSARFGQICNAALDHDIIAAYNKNSGAEGHQRCREGTEPLAILTGLEMGSARSGVRPDLEKFLSQWTVNWTPFLQYKYLAEYASTQRAWYEPTHAVKFKEFFGKVDWSQVGSNMERLPYLAHQARNCPLSSRSAQLAAQSGQGHWGHSVRPAQGLRGVFFPRPGLPGACPSCCRWQIFTAGLEIPTSGLSTSAKSRGDHPVQLRLLCQLLPGTAGVPPITEQRTEPFPVQSFAIPTEGRRQHGKARPQAAQICCRIGVQARRIWHGADGFVSNYLYPRVIRTGQPVGHASFCGRQE